MVSFVFLGQEVIDYVLCLCSLKPRIVFLHFYRIVTKKAEKNTQQQRLVITKPGTYVYRTRVPDPGPESFAGGNGEIRAYVFLKSDV